MFKHFLLHTNTHIVLATAISIAVYMMGYLRVALVVWLVMLCFIIARGMYRSEDSGKAYKAGLCIGSATLVWTWSLVAFLLYLVFLFGPMKVFSMRVFWASCWGLLTPLWCYAPYWIYNNVDYLSIMIINAKEALL